jgi:hypothetical protein
MMLVMVISPTLSAFTTISSLVLGSLFSLSKSSIDADGSIGISPERPAHGWGHDRPKSDD